MTLSTATAAPDHMALRQNSTAMALAEANIKLAAIADAFGEKWLTQGGGRPLQLLWDRRDAFATMELLNFGDAIEHLAKLDPNWLVAQVKTIKSNDQGNAAGAIFEILGLNLFSNGNCTIVPAPASKPGFDGTLVLSDGAFALFSIKNHGRSSYERAFHAAAARIDGMFRAAAWKKGLRDVGLRILADSCPGPSDWDKIRQDVEAMVSHYGTSPSARNTTRGGWHMSIYPLDPTYQPSAKSKLSATCQIFAPHDSHEQTKFQQGIAKGCANLVKHSKAETRADACRVIILRLSSTASIPACAKWAEWYFTENPDTSLAAIILYQTTIVDDGADQSTLVQYLVPFTGPAFAAWRVRADGSTRALPMMSVLVGTVVDQPPLLVAKVPGGSIDLSAYYAYQAGDIYRAVDPTVGSSSGTIGTPAPGITVHMMLEGPGTQSHMISPRTHAERTLLLLP